MGELPGRARTTHLSNIRDGIELDEEEGQLGTVGDLRQNTFLGFYNI